MTHVSAVRSLKTDDDCYVRMAYVLRTIQARESWSVLGWCRTSLYKLSCLHACWTRGFKHAHH